MNRWRRWRTSILLILAVLGPGFITANVDNDSGGIYTYATAGAQFGYALLWTMIPMAIMLAFAQEISARMGVVTGKGLSELIREEFGLRITAILMFGLVLCNLGDVVSEFAGVSSSAALFHISKWISVPFVAVLVWVLVVSQIAGLVLVGALALATQPHFILLDEPLAGIDPIAVADIRGLVGHLKDRGIGVLITDHNVRETLGLTDRAYIIYSGEVLMEGRADDIVNNPDVRRLYLGEEFRL